MSADESLTPTMLGSRARRAMVSGVMSTTERPGNVVDDQRQLDRVVDCPIVGVEPLLGRLVVVGRHDQGGVGAGALGVPGQADRLLGRVRAGAGDHRRAARRPPRCTARSPARARHGSGSGSRRWCRPARNPGFLRPDAIRPGSGTPPRRACRCGTASRARQSSHETCRSTFRILGIVLVECEHNRPAAGIDKRGPAGLGVLRVE